MNESSPVIELLRGGFVVPMTSMAMETTLTGLFGRIDGGVYHSSGDVCERGLVVKPHHVNEPRPLQASDSTLLTGRHLFGGMLSNEHFGHFIAENLSRLWAMDHLDPSYCSIVYYLRIPHRPVATFILETIGILFPGARVTIVTKVSHFETLAVPQDLLHGSYLFGHPFIRAMCNRLRMRETGISRKVFVSRSGLPRPLGGLLADQRIDELLAAEGYEVIFPEKMSIKEQLKIYSSADHLIFADGSALHLYALVALPDQKVFVIWRRAKNHAFDLQVQSFGGRPLYGDAYLKELWVPEVDLPHTSRGKAVLDFGKLSEQLKADGFVSGPRWSQPSDQCLQEELMAISIEKNRKYVLKALS